MKNKGNVISRRKFLQDAAVGAASLTAIGLLEGCAPKQVPSESSSNVSQTEAPTKVPVSETQTTDIVVVGGGNSGLAAAVQAAQLGAKVTVLESQKAIGGGGQGTEGILGIGSKMQKAKGIEVDIVEKLDEENRVFNYRLNAWFWKDMLNASGEDIDWLVDNGVLFKGDVDDYHGWGHGLKVFHWWKDGKGINYTQPMGAKAKSLGVTILVETPAKSLITDGGKVTGIYATKADGSIIQINCKAVILASGGYAANKDMMTAHGQDMVANQYVGFPGQNGDALRMAIDAGGVDITTHRGFMRTVGYFGTIFMTNLSFAIDGISPVWVNQDGQRYIREDLQPTYMDSYAVNAIMSQEKSFVVFDQGLLEKMASSQPDLISDAAKLVKENKGGIFQADTIEELATKAGMDPKALADTIAQYNAMCDQKADKDWNKPSELMIALTKAPFYIFRHQVAYITSIGGILINRKMEVINASGNAITGLFAAGTAACELYRETYTIDKPGSMNGHNIYSGRTAAKNAVAIVK